MSIKFEWDTRKDERNRLKHRVSFAMAREIFLDPLVATVIDPRHPAEEMRFFSIEVTLAGRLLSVGHTDDETTVRIITARDATPTERMRYEEGN